MLSYLCCRFASVNRQACSLSAPVAPSETVRTCRDGQGTCADVGMA